MAKVIALGGEGAKKYFAPATETTARHDGWLMVQIADAGIMKYIGQELTLDGARDLWLDLLRSGKRELLLAGLLVEQDTTWTPAKALEIAEWFASLTDAESKTTLQAQLMPLLAGFFLSAMPSSAPSLNALGMTASQPLPTNVDEASIAPGEPAPAASG